MRVPKSKRAQITEDNGIFGPLGVQCRNENDSFPSETNIPEVPTI